MSLSGPTCVQARTEVSRRPGFGFQSPSFQQGVHLPRTWPQPWLVSSSVQALGDVSSPTMPLKGR